MAFALEYGQAVPVRAHPALEDRVAVVEQVVCGDRGSDVACGFAHVVGGVQRGDVFEDHAQRRKVATQRDQLGVDEHPLAIEHVDLPVGDLAVHAQRQAESLHRFEHPMAAGEVGYAGGFVEHYVLPVLYPAALTRDIQFALALVVVAANLAVYGWLLISLRRPLSASGRDAPAHRAGR